jgi:SAM-dependent methyltransferase
VSRAPSFRPDLYRGTAAYYDRFRLPYPAALIEDLCRRVSASGSGRLLDLACGPGTATLALARHFAEVWAVDQEPEAIDFAAGKAAELGVDNVRWLVGRAEDVDPKERFDLVTVGTAFHRLDRRRIADLARQSLRAGGHLALLWSSTPINGPAPWQPAVADIVVDWMQRLDAQDRVPADLEALVVEHPHTAMLEDAGFVILGRYEFEGVHDWTPSTITGFLYSTSLLSRAVVGGRREEFEADVDERLAKIEPSGVFREQTSFAYDLAARPPD